MRYPDQHLSADELESLGQGEGLSDGREEDLGAAREHVQSCPSCRRRLEVYPTTGAKLEKLRASRRAPKGPDCPSVEVWLNLAGRLLPTADQERYTTHAATCDHCGPILREIVHDFEEPVTEEEKSVLAGMKTTASLPQRKFDNRVLPPRAIPHPRHWFRLPAWQLATAAVVILAAISFSLYKVGIFRNEDSVASVNDLLAQAYTEQRTIEPRIPGAKYAPIHVKRGPSESNLNKPAALLKAEALIGDNLRKNSDDPIWLEAKARADLLDGNYESAISSLNRALESKPDSPELLADLGTAYFQKAEATSDRSNYGKAIEQWGEALSKSPENPVALFNRALAYERTSMFHEAASDWEHYLRIDPKGSWAGEAGRHLDDVRRKLTEQQQRVNSPLLSAATITAALSQSQPDIRARVDGRIEEYLDLAVREWLPNAFPADQQSVPSRLREESYAALYVLAQILATQHQDTWLMDLLKNHSTASLSVGIQALAEAAQKDRAGNPALALPHALAAEVQFDKANDAAGKMRAQLEEIYALHRKFSPNCLERISAIAPPVQSTHYQWIKIQLNLERYACQSSAELRLSSTADLLSNARTAARRFRYGTLYLRALGFTAARETEMGFPEKAWEWDTLGLQEYWSGSYPPLRAQQFYDDLSIQAQDSGKWFLAVALGREAVCAIADTPNRSGEAMARVRLAQSAMQAGMWPEASEQYLQALKTFGSANDEDATAFRAQAEIGLAAAELREGNIRSSEEHLQYVRTYLPKDFQEYQTWLFFYSTLAEFRKLTGDPVGSERACAAVVFIGEIGLRGIQTESERIRWNRTTARCYKQAVDTALNRGDTIRALKLWEWFLSSGIRPPSYIPHVNNFYGLEAQVTVPSLNELKSELDYPSNETVIIYADLQDQVVAWLYDGRRVVWRPLGVTSPHLKLIASRFLQQCSDPRSRIADLLKNSRSLYDLLIRPFSSNLDPKRTLVIEAEGEFEKIPFAALSDDAGRFLVDVVPIVYLPGNGYQRRLRPISPISRDDVALVIGNPVLPESKRGSYEILPDAGLEAEQVAGRFTHSTLLAGAHATSTALLGNLRKAKILHFAGHTRVEAGRIQLLLSSETNNPTFFDSDSLVSGQLAHLQLAVLSACSTDRDASTGSGGPETIARAFLRNGVPEIVATRWEVDSAATSVFMASFYDEVLRGRSVPAALAVAMKEVRKVPYYSHPYYWAAFDAFGRAGKIAR